MRRKPSPSITRRGAAALQSELRQVGVIPAAASVINQLSQRAASENTVRDTSSVTTHRRFLLCLIVFVCLFLTLMPQPAPVWSSTSIIEGIFTPPITFRYGSAFRLLQVKRVIPALEPWLHINTDFQPCCQPVTTCSVSSRFFSQYKIWSKHREKSHLRYYRLQLQATDCKRHRKGNDIRNSLKPAADLSLEAAINSQ